MDDVDRELLRFLTLDARRPASELARELGVSRVTIQNRIDKLKSTGAIKRFTIEGGENAQGALIEALVLATVEAGDSRKTLSQLKRMSEVVTLATANGAYDIVMEIRVSSLQRLDELLMDIRRMPMIADTNSIIRLKRFK